MYPTTSAAPTVPVDSTQLKINQDDFYYEVKKLFFSKEREPREVNVYKQLSVKQMFCGVCLDWAKDPVTVCKPQQLHIFCRSCVKPTDVTKCPSCREPAKEAYKSDFINHFESLLKLTDWQCPVSCGSLVPDADLEAHVKNCKPSQCEFCGEKGHSQWLRQHLLLCEYVSIPCDLCAAPMKRGDIEAHKLSVCPEAVVTEHIVLIDQTVALKRHHAQVLQSEGKQLAQTEFGGAIRELFRQCQQSGFSKSVGAPATIAKHEILLNKTVTLSVFEDSWAGVELGHITIPTVKAIADYSGSEENADYLEFGMVKQSSTIRKFGSMGSLAEGRVGFTIDFASASNIEPNTVSAFVSGLGRGERTRPENNKQEYLVSVYGDSVGEDELLFQHPFSLASVDFMVTKYNCKFRYKKHTYDESFLKEAVFSLFFYEGFPGYDYVEKHGLNTKFRLCVEKLLDL